jgi:hypothetical protein
LRALREARPLAVLVPGATPLLPDVWGHRNQRAAELVEERGRLRQQVATLEEKSLGEQMVTHRQRLELTRVSTLAEQLVQQLAVATDESQWALSHAHEQSAQTEHLSDELGAVRAHLEHAQQQISLGQQQQADASAEAAAHSKAIVDLEAELAAAHVCRDDLKAQLVKALAAKSALAGARCSTVARIRPMQVSSLTNHATPCADRVDHVLAEMDAHNRVLGIQVAAAEAARKPRAPAMPVLDERPSAQRCVNAGSARNRQDLAAQELLLTVQLQPSPGVGADGKENRQSSPGAPAASKTPKTPKAALRKRLLEARTALGGVKLGEAPKRSISFHPDFRHGVCDDDLV